MVLCLSFNDCDRVVVSYPDPFNTQHLQCEIYKKPFITTPMFAHENWITSGPDTSTCPAGFSNFNMAGGCYMLLCDGTWKVTWQEANDACDAIEPGNSHLAGTTQEGSTTDV